MSDILHIAATFASGAVFGGIAVRYHFGKKFKAEVEKIEKIAMDKSAKG